MHAHGSDGALRSIGLICCGHRAIALENLALRQQLAVLRRTVTRPHLRSSDRLFWILLAKGWRDWRSALIVVQPDTVVRWHRQWLRRRWARLSQRRRPGRPTTDSAIRALISTMTAANPLWGAPRIHGELAKLGITVSERTVSRLLRRPHRPPAQTWRTFLTHHVGTMVSMDFFTVSTLARSPRMDDGGAVAGDPRPESNGPATCRAMPEFVIDRQHTELSKPPSMGRLVRPGLKPGTPRGIPELLVERRQPHRGP